MLYEETASVEVRLIPDASHASSRQQDVGTSYFFPFVSVVRTFTMRHA